MITEHQSIDRYLGMVKVLQFVQRCSSFGCKDTFSKEELDCRPRRIIRIEETVQTDASGH